MGKVSNALKMYMLLQVRGVMKAGEIAEELGVTPRMVKRYKDDLAEADIYIESILGRHGGYYLASHMNLSGIQITKKELESLKMASKVIKNGNYYYATDFAALAGKVLNEKNDFGDVSYHVKKMTSPSTMGKITLWNNINLAITKMVKLEINYASLGSKHTSLKERTIHPYGMFDYKGATYCYGYCELRKDVRFFKLDRIKQEQILKEKFVVNTKFDLKQMMEQSFGIYNDEAVNLELEIYYPMSQIVKEKIYSSNQKIKDIDKNTISFEARMKGYTEIKSWVMGMGSLVKVIQPLILKEEIIREASKVMEIYNINKN